MTSSGICHGQTQVQALRNDNIRLAQEAAAAQAQHAAAAQEPEAALQRQRAQHAEREAKLQAQLEEGQRQLATAREQLGEARVERNLFMMQAAEAAESAQVHVPATFRLACNH